MLHDHKSFFLFLLLTLLTAFVFYSGLTNDIAYTGMLGIAWGLFGFYRFLYLMASGDSDPHIQRASLPQILLSNMRRKEQKKSKYVLHTLSRLDVVLWFTLGFAFILWMIWQTYFPAEVPFLAKLEQEQEAILGDIDRGHYNLYQVVVAVLSYGLTGLMLFCGLSYGYSPTCTRWGYMILLPLLLVMGYFMFVQAHVAVPVYWPVSTELLGGGLGRADIVARLLPDFINQSGTPLIRRFVEGGSVAGYGLVLVFIPMMVALVIGVVRLRILAVAGLLMMAALIYVDTHYLLSPIVDAALVLLFVLLGLAWGASRSTAKT